MSPAGKRLFICCDGTGRDSIREKNEYVTNVARFARCLQPMDDDGVLQLVYYHNGVALHNGEFQYREAATGQGIHGMIQDAYYFLCLNLGYRNGQQDEVHLVGFSRGAFAVRALACFINDVGILSRTHLALLPMLYALWRKQDLAQLRSHTSAWENKGHLRRNVKIDSCGVWDTVSAMIPASDLAFVHNAVPTNLRFAFHAISLHETHTSFLPVLWNTEEAQRTRQTLVKQCWLPGDHSDIGGGHPDAGMAAISLLWMVAQYKEYTKACITDLVLLDCMTPLFLHWQEKAFLNWEEMTLFNKEEYLMQSHVFTKGNVHGPESFATALWHLPGQTSLAVREPMFQARSLPDHMWRSPQVIVNASQDNISPGVYYDDKPTTEFTFSEKEGHVTVANTSNDIGCDDSSTVLSQWPEIHFTVRILMSARHQDCHLLSRYTTFLRDNRVVWADVTGNRGFLEERPVAWETWMFRQWIKREEELFGTAHSTFASSDDERLTRFLYPYRREGEKPRKVFYAPAPRTSSTNRSRKIQDANDLMEEAYEKGPDLNQSHSSAATSIGSGVRYFLDLDYEGDLPERFKKIGSSAMTKRELQLGALYLSRRLGPQNAPN